MKPQLYKYDAVDATTEIILKFIWNGNQTFGNSCVIRNNITDEIVYQATETTMQSRHVISPNTLINGVLYNARIATIDINNNMSEYSDPILFYCFTTPTFIFDNLTKNQVVRNASYQVLMSYSQIENEPLKSWEISLYDHSKNLIQTSNINYSNNIKYTLTNLEDNQSYYIKATCMTLNGMEISTEYISFSVNYKQPAIYSILTLENIKENGYIKLQSNIRAVEAHSEKDIEYIDNEYVNLKDNKVFIDKDFSLDDDFIINLLGYNLVSGKLIMQLSDGTNNVSLYLRNGIYDVNNNVNMTFVELSIPIGFTRYICFSNYINTPKDSDLLSITVKRKNQLFNVYITNESGE